MVRRTRQIDPKDKKMPVELERQIRQTIENVKKTSKLLEQKGFDSQAKKYNEIAQILKRMLG